MELVFGIRGTSIVLLGKAVADKCFQDSSNARMEETVVHGDDASLKLAFRFFTCHSLGFFLCYVFLERSHSLVIRYCAPGQIS